MSQMVTCPATATLIYLAGQVSDDLSDDIAVQTQSVLAKIDGLLSLAGSDKTGLVSAQIWLRDMGDFDAMNPVWEQWLPEGRAPVRACVEARLADPRLKIEIQVIAVKTSA
ncbi:RidA family protein [Acerihabitans sp. KWT182]|uniref:RidA family protein n=1 Tax=Acerihabitans sp. KWT182 TaxID=3157919 RepID=A0AAU7QFQ2_9GAMM